MKIKELKTLLDEYPEDMKTVEHIDLSVMRLFDYNDNSISDKEYLSLVSMETKEVYGMFDALKFLEQVDDKYYPVLEYLSNILILLLKYRIRCYCDCEFFNQGSEPVNMSELEAECESKLKQLADLLGMSSYD